MAQRWFYQVACDILELGRGVDRRKCGLRLVISQWPEVSVGRDRTIRTKWRVTSQATLAEPGRRWDRGGEGIELMYSRRVEVDLQTIVAPLVSDSETKKSIKSDRTRTSKSTVTCSISIPCQTLISYEVERLASSRSKTSHSVIRPIQSCTLLLSPSEIWCMCLVVNSTYTVLRSGHTSQDRHPAMRVVYLDELYVGIHLLNLGSGKRQYRIVRLGWMPILFLDILLPCHQRLAVPFSLYAEKGPTPGEFINTSLPLILQDRVLVNRLPARIRSKVDFPARISALSQHT